MFTLKVYTGPDLTHEMIEKCRQAGLGTPLRGTEHIYPAVEATGRSDAPQRFLEILDEHHGTDFGLGSALGGALARIRLMPVWKAL